MNEPELNAIGQTDRETGDTCMVQHETIDALAVGQSLRMLARSEKTPHGTREVYSRVGAQMVAAAQLALVKQGRR